LNPSPITVTVDGMLLGGGNHTGLRFSRRILLIPTLTVTEVSPTFLQCAVDLDMYVYYYRTYEKAVSGGGRGG